MAEGAARGQRIALENEFLIGRAMGEDGRLGDDPELSRRHARLARDGGRLTIEDLGSANGTFVNGERLTAPRPLAVGDSVRMGQTTLEVVAPGEATEMHDPVAPPTSPARARPPAPAPDHPPTAPEPAARPPQPQSPQPQSAASRSPRSRRGRPARRRRSRPPGPTPRPARRPRPGRRPRPVLPPPPRRRCPLPRATPPTTSSWARSSRAAASRRSSAGRHGRRLPGRRARPPATGGAEDHPARELPEERFRQRFQRESRTAASIDHPNVIPILEAGDQDGVLFITMRLVEGTDLRALISGQGPVDPRRAARIVRQVGAGLDAAHKQGLVHRDVKPANVLLARGDHVYLSDFGLAKQETRGRRADPAGLDRGPGGVRRPRADHRGPRRRPHRRLRARLPAVREPHRSGARTPDRRATR